MITTRGGGNPPPLVINQTMLPEQNAAELLVENRDAGEHVHGHEMTLVVAVVGDHDTHRQVVPVRHGGDRTRPLAGQSERTHDEGNRIPVEREVELARGTEVDSVGVGDRRVERTIERDARQTVDRDDRVNRSRRRRNGVAERDDLADLRSDGEAVHDDRLRPASGITAGQVDRTRSHASHHRSGDDRRRQTRCDRHTRGVAEGVGHRRDTMRDVVARDRHELTDREGTREAVHRQNGGTGRQVARIDRTRERRVARRDDGHVLVHPEVPTELAPERGFLEGLTLVADLLSLSEQIEAQERGLGQRVQHKVSTLDRSLVDVEDLTQGEQNRPSVGRGQAAEGTGRVREELGVLAEDHLIDEPSLGDDRRTKEFVDQRLERLRLFTVLDHEGRVNVLVQGNLHGGRGHVLHDHAVGVRLALGDEFGRLRHVDHVAVASEDILEVAVDQIAADHVLDQDGNGFVRPHLRDEDVDAVVEHRSETEAELAIAVHGKILVKPALLKPP